MPWWLELGSYHAILACVTAGVGCAIVPRNLLAIYPQRGLLRTRALPKTLAVQPTWVVTRKLSFSPSLAAFCDLVIGRGVLRAARSARRAAIAA